MNGPDISRSVAVIAGAGPGSGAAIARKLLSEGYAVGLIARGAETLEEVRQSLGATGQRVVAVAADLAEAEQVRDAFARIRRELGPLRILVCHATAASWKGLMDVSPAEFEAAWRSSAWSAFLSAREAVPDMIGQGGGAILITGATSSIRGRAGAVDFTSAKFALRGLAESLAREWWPQGIHVAHVLIDGLIDTPRLRATVRPGPNEPLLQPSGIAEAYWGLIRQEPSAWTFELDLRPYNEAFLE